MAHPNPKLRWIFGSQDRTDRIGSTAHTKKTELADCFWTKISRNIDERRSLDRSFTYSLRVRRTRAPQRTRMKLCRWGEGKHAVCAHAGRVGFPFAPVDLVHQQRHVAGGGCPRPRRRDEQCVLRVWRMLQSRLRVGRAHLTGWPPGSLGRWAIRVCEQKTLPGRIEVRA